MDSKDLKSLAETFLELKKGLQGVKDSLSASTKRLATDVKETFKSGIAEGVKTYANDLKEGARLYSEELKAGISLYAEELKEGTKFYVNTLKNNTEKYKVDLQRYGASLVKRIGEKGNDLVDQSKSLYKKETQEEGTIRKGLTNLNETLLGIWKSIKDFFKRDKLQDQRDRILGIQKTRLKEYGEVAKNIAGATAKGIENLLNSNLFGNILKGLGLLALFLSPESIAKAIKTVAEGFVTLARLINSDEFKEGLSVITEFLGNVIKFGLERLTQFLDGVAGVAKNLDLLFKGEFGKIDWGDFIGDIGNVTAGFAGLALVLAPASALMLAIKGFARLITKEWNYLKNKYQPNASSPKPATQTPSTGNQTSPGARMPGNPRITAPATTPTARGPMSGVRDALGRPVIRGRDVRDAVKNLRRPRNLALLFVGLFQNQLTDFMAGVYGSFGVGIQTWSDDKLKEVIDKHEQVRQQQSGFLGIQQEMSSEHAMFIREAQRRGLQGYQTGGMITVPGSGSGDKVPMMLAPGSFVLNREASNVFFQKGGMVPTILEPGEKVFGPGSWGPDIMAMNNIVPRFQTGGIVEHLHGDPSRPGYRADHGSQSNAHDHFAFSTPEMMRRVRDSLASGQTQSGRSYQIGSQNDGQHAPNSYHYTNQAFDIPWSQFGSGPITENDFAQSRQLASDVRGILTSLQGSSPTSVTQVSTTTTTTSKPPKYDPEKSYNTGDIVTWTDGSLRQFDGMGWDLPQNTSTSVNAPTRQPGMPDAALNVNTVEQMTPTNPFAGLGAFEQMFGVIAPLLTLGNSFINNILGGFGGAAMASTAGGSRSESTSDPGSSDGSANNTNVNPAIAPQNAKATFDYMKSIGLSEIHAKGLLANAIRESSLNPAAVGDNGTSFGLFQWHADRATKMKSALGDNWQDWREQIKYALIEQGEPGPQWRGMAFGSAQAAADWWMRNWERPANPARASSKHQSILAGLGFQKGGMIPTMLEPGEKVFAPGSWGPEQMAMNNIIPRFNDQYQSGGMVAMKTQPKYKISPSTASTEFSTATQASRMNGMYDMKSQPVVVTVPQPQVNVTGAATTTSSTPNLASSPRSAVASDYMFRNALSQAIHN